MSVGVTSESCYRTRASDVQKGREGQKTEPHPMEVGDLTGWVFRPSASPEKGDGTVSTS